MMTNEEMKSVHAPLDRASLALGDLIEARVIGNEAKIQDAIDRLSRELGDVAFALREIRVGNFVEGIMRAAEDDSGQ